MMRVTDLYIPNRDVKAFQRRVTWLERRLTELDPEVGACGFHRAELEAFKRLLSQVEEKGISLDTPRKSEDAFDASRLRRLGWNVKYTGHSNPKPWTAVKQFNDLAGLSAMERAYVVSIEAASFAELEKLAEERDMQCR